VTAFLRRPALLCAAAALALAGCDKPAQPRVATVQSAPGTSTGSPTPKESDYDKALRYTRCMTAEGSPMPDPVEGEPLLTGSMIKAGADGTGWVVRGDSFDKCKKYLPATWPVKVSPEELAKTRPFAECMRQRGIAWPEPDARGMVPYSTDPYASDTPEYRAAENACRYLYDDPANDLPENK
jgi:hypothetical protein